MEDTFSFWYCTFVTYENARKKLKPDSVPYLSLYQPHSAPGPKSQMAVRMQCLRLGSGCNVGYPGWGTVAGPCGRRFGSCPCVSARRGLSQRRCWQLGRHKTESSQTVQERTSIPFDLLSPDDDNTQLNQTCIFTQGVGLEESVVHMVSSISTKCAA